MPWVWVAVGLLLWTVAVCAVIALCLSVRQIDARLGRDRKGAHVTRESKPRAGAAAKVE
jgi:hypothetical protein